jgi:hypothetical protein
MTIVYVFVVAVKILSVYFVTIRCLKILTIIVNRFTNQTKMTKKKKKDDWVKKAWSESKKLEMAKDAKKVVELVDELHNLIHKYESKRKPRRTKS